MYHLFKGALILFGVSPARFGQRIFFRASTTWERTSLLSAISCKGCHLQRTRNLCVFRDISDATIGTIARPFPYVYLALRHPACSTQPLPRPRFCVHRLPFPSPSPLAPSPSPTGLQRSSRQARRYSASVRLRTCVWSERSYWDQSLQSEVHVYTVLCQVVVVVWQTSEVNFPRVGLYPSAPVYCWLVKGSVRLWREVCFWDLTRQTGA